MITVVGSLKGGSGKSTVAFNLAIWLAMAEQQVTAIDADPQCTLSDVMGIRGEESFQPLVKVSKSDLLDQPERLKDPKKEVLIDIGTANMDAVKKALKLADRVLVPVPPSQADIWSTQRFIRFVQAHVDAERPPEVLGFINRADTHIAIRESDEAAAALVSLPGIRFIKPRLAQRTIYRRSFSEGLAVFEMRGRSQKAAQEWNSLVALLYPHLVS